MELKKVLERLSKERVGTPVAVLYTEPDSPEHIRFEALGRLQKFHSYDETVRLENPFNSNIYSMHLPKDHHVIEIPSEGILDYKTLKAKPYHTL